MVHMIVQLPLSARARSCEQSDKDVMLSKPAWANPADRIKLAVITVPFFLYMKKHEIQTINKGMKLLT